MPISARWAEGLFQADTKSGHELGAVTSLVLLAAPAGAWIIAAHLADPGGCWLA